MKTIVVGVDGSEHADRALLWAIAEARGHGDTRIVAVHAWDLPMTPWAVGFGAPDLSEYERTAGEALGHAVDRVAAGLQDGVTIDRRVLQGPATRTLLDVAVDQHADLLVVGTRGLGGFKSLMLGSVASALATHSPVPLVIVPQQRR